MKLSSAAKEYVKAQVKEAFAKDLTEADENLQQVIKDAKVKWNKFNAELKTLFKPMDAQVQKLVKKYGLTPCKGSFYHEDDPCTVGVDLFVAYPDGSYGGRANESNFCETSNNHSKLRNAALARIEKVKEQIEKACGKALYEIEVHGKKDTLQAIVDEVIREIKEGK